MAEIRNCAKRGDTVTSKILAKQVIQGRDQQTRLLKLQGTMKTVQHKTTVHQISLT